MKSQLIEFWTFLVWDSLPLLSEFDAVHLVNDPVSRFGDIFLMNGSMLIEGMHINSLNCSRNRLDYSRGGEDQAMIILMHRAGNAGIVSSHEHLGSFANFFFSHTLGG